MVRPPKGSTRSVKFVVDEIQGTSGTAVDSFVLVTGADNDSLGQSTGTDTVIPTGAKVKQINIMTCWGSITGVSTFLHWSIQHVKSSQSVISPILVGGNPLRNNVMMQGMICIGDRQNATLDIKYKIPKPFWRLKDGEKWILVTLCSTNVDTVKQAVYKVFV